MKTLSLNAEKVLGKRYYERNEKGEIIESWPKLAERVSKHIASTESEPEKWAPKYRELMTNLKFLPNSPVLRNAGANQGCLSACFVLPIKDDLSDIYDSLRKASLVQKFGGGTGFSFSSLRPEGAAIERTGGASSGPVSFMRVFDFSLGEVIRQGGTRPGANMGVLRVDHPDILRFIEAKKDGLLRNFNISVGITDEFMRCLEEGGAFKLQFNGKLYQRLKASKIWEQITDMAWATGDPGVLFLDTINRENPLAGIAAIEATNPCGEQPLIPYGSCTLGSINLGVFVKGDWTNEQGIFDADGFRETVSTAVRFLDDVVEANSYPIDEIAKAAFGTRQIGLGVMGFADLMSKMRVRYGSEESLSWAKRIAQVLYGQAKLASEELAKEKGAFPELERLKSWKEPPRRNALLTSCAPTGTLSLIADCSGGIEPHFAFNFGKNCLDGQKLEMVPYVVREWIKKHGSEQPLPEFFVTAHDVTPQEHLAVQAAFQRNGIDSGVSKTVNLPSNATRQMVDEIYRTAWKLGCKGTTVYRDGCKDVQALVLDTPQSLKRGELKHRARGTSGPNVKMRTACGNLYVNPCFDPDGLVEVFLRSRGGGCEANMEAVGTLASYCLRYGADPQKIIDRLKAIKCSACIRAIEKGREVDVQSCAAGVGTAMDIALKTGQAFIGAAKSLVSIEPHFVKNGSKKQPGRPKMEKCPDCMKDSLQPESGCVVCITPGCGYSRC